MKLSDVASKTVQDSKKVAEKTWQGSKTAGAKVARGTKAIGTKVKEVAQSETVKSASKQVLKTSKKVAQSETVKSAGAETKGFVKKNKDSIGAGVVTGLAAGAVPMAIPFFGFFASSVVIPVGLGVTAALIVKRKWEEKPKDHDK